MMIDNKSYYKIESLKFQNFQKFQKYENFRLWMDLGGT